MPDTPDSLRKDLMDRLDPRIRVKSLVPFVVEIPPEVGGLSTEQALLIQMLQKDSISREDAQRLAWMKAKDSWKRASDWLGQQAGKAASLGKSLISEVVGPEIPLPTLQKRHVSCFGKTVEGDYVQPPCQNLTKSEKHRTHYCGGCGCGDTVLTQLEPGLVASKLLFPHLECPLKKPGFSNEYEDSDFDRKKRIAIFDPSTGGLGDLIAVLWIAGGYLETGWQVKFLTSAHDWLVRGCGFDVTDDRSQGCYMLGASFEPYQTVELTIDKGKTPRVPLWSSVLPSSPRPVKPILALPDLATRVARANWKTAQDLGGGKGKKILLAPFSHWKPRSWPLHHYYTLAEILRSKGHTVMAMGLPHNEDDLRGFPFGYAGLSPQESFATVQQADLLICNDSGPAWMATLTDTPTTVLLGPTKNIFGNFSHIRQVSNKDMWCTGCHFSKEGGYRLPCDYGCESLSELKPNTVYSIIEESLDGNAG